MWCKSPRSLARLSQRQLRDYYRRQVRLFFTDRMIFWNGQRSKSPFERRHQPQTWGWGGPEWVRGIIDKLKAIRSMLRDGYERKPAPKKGATGACAIDREDEPRQRDPHKDDRR